MIKLTLEIQNDVQNQKVEITDNGTNIDPTVDDFLDMFEGGLSSLGFANYKFEQIEEEK